MFSQDAAAFVASLRDQITGTVCRVVAVCASQLIPSCSLALPVSIQCVGVVEGHSDSALFPTWPMLSGYNLCFTKVNLFRGSKSVHSSGTVLQLAVVPLRSCQIKQDTQE